MDADETSLALIVAREGIAMAVPPPPAVPNPQPLAPIKRLRRIEEQFGHAILMFEILETLTVTPAPADAAEAKMKLVGRGTAGPKTLLTLNIPTPENFAEEVNLVLGYADLRSERMAEINVQTAALIPFFLSMVPLRAARAPMTQRLMALTLDVATATVQRIKLGFAAPRAEMFSDQVQPMIATPLHGSYPSGHATQAFALATLLSILTRQDTTAPTPIGPESQLFRSAARVATNRVVAGVHFPSDSASGAFLGITVARWIAGRAGVLSEPCPHLNFKARKWGETAANHSRDFYLARLCEVLDGDPCLSIGTPVEAPVSDLMSALWAEAETEWALRWS